MDQQTYQVVFDSTGIVKSNRKEIKQNFAALFQKDASIIAYLFTNRPVVLRKHLDWETAERYRVAIQKAGALCSIEPEGDLDSNLVSSQTEIIRCPFCRNIIHDDTEKCAHCGGDIKSYISGFKAKGKIFIKGVGMANDRRKFDRRARPDRRSEIRFEDSRRVDDDRRAGNQYWNGAS